jgi:protein TonB
MAERAGIDPRALARAPLARALVASIGFHAGLLLGMPDIWTHMPAPPDLPSLTAWIAPAPAAVVREEQPAVAEVKPLPQKPAPKRERAEHRPPPRVQTPSPTALAPAVPTPAPEPPATPAIASTSEPATETPVAPVAEVPVTQAVAPPAIAVPEQRPPTSDPGSLAQYRLALAATARRHKLYPSNAIDRGWQGKVEVRLFIGADGQLDRAQVKTSSGHDVLDRQALEMMKKATSLTPIPPALRERGFAVEMPVVFELKNDN